MRVAASALIDQFPPLDADVAGHRSTGLQELSLIRLGQRRRNTVSAKQQLATLHLIEVDFTHFAA